MIKSNFSIADLENLSGIKSHTIRIWEKRYQLFKPQRTETNIRYYDLDALQKILNISFLRDQGYKISSIAALKPQELENLVSQCAQEQNKNHQLIQQLKFAMINFDQDLFNITYNKSIQNASFSKVFYNLFIPFLEELGQLWHSNTINIAHEHFISHLIKQKLTLAIEQVQQSKPINNNTTFILFLPENEMHDLGLLYLNYELLKLGFKTIYLGASMILKPLALLQQTVSNPIYITYLTVAPIKNQIPEYLNQFNIEVAQDNDIKLWLLGNLTRSINSNDLNTNQLVFNSTKELINQIPNYLTS